MSYADLSEGQRMSKEQPTTGKRLPLMSKPEGVIDLSTRLRTAAMTRYGIPRRQTDEKGNSTPPLNWRRGLLRVWMLVSAAWIMGWAVYLIIYGIQSGFRGSDFFAIAVLLFGPPVALLLFGLLAGWAFRGFKPE